jgi:hypothetical protein
VVFKPLKLTVASVPGTQWVTIMANPGTYPLVLLLGSGVSVPAQMPSVAEVTEVVLGGCLHGRSFNLHSDGKYYTHPNVLTRPPKAELKLINALYKRCQGYFSRDVDYEDVAYVLWQVANEQSGNYENPAIVPLLQRLRRIIPEKDLPHVSGEACTYISCVVERMLAKRPDLGHLAPLIRAAATHPLVVFTLNHDTVIEQELKNGNIEYSDGFELHTPTCAYWDPVRATASPKGVKLYKLHGSTNWHRYRPDPDNPHRQLVGRALNNDFEHTRDLAGEMQYPLGSDTEMLIGSFNKIIDYSSGIYADLFQLFRSSLRDTNRLVVSGYGFRDKGVNTSITEWLTSSVDKRLVIIHKHPRQLLGHARGAIQTLSDRCGAQVEFIESWFEEATLT